MGSSVNQGKHPHSVIEGRVAGQSSSMADEPCPESCFRDFGISSADGFASLVSDRDWISRAIDLLQCDGRRSADTHLINPSFPALEGIAIYLKDESTHPTGSLKHRLARSLILYGICNGHIRPGTTLVEASSGSTAVSEAYFARLLGLPFIAVMPRTTSLFKIEAIQRLGGRCHFIEHPSAAYAVAAGIATETGGHYLDQFTNAERATDWRGNNNIAESIFRQMQSEPHPVPEWIVMSAGTGGTAATLGRYIRHQNLSTRLCVADVEFSAFFPAYRDGTMQATCARPSRIEGVGRPRVEPSFIPGIVDQMVCIPDAASIAAAHVLSERLFRRVGGSTGTNFMALLWLADKMRRQGRRGSLATLICDSGDRYANTYFSEDWLAKENLDIRRYKSQIGEFLDTGRVDHRGGSWPASVRPER